MLRCMYCNQCTAHFHINSSEYGILPISSINMFTKVTSVILLVAFCVVVSCNPTSQNDRSSEDVIDDQDVLRAASANKQRYIVFNNKRVNFFEAWRACMSLGLRLATVTDAEDDADLLVALRNAGTHHKGPWFIAGTDLGRESSFVWMSTNQKVGHETGYSNWAQDQPDNGGGNEHCIEIGYHGGSLWNDVNCQYTRSYVCERAQ